MKNQSTIEQAKTAVLLNVKKFDSQFYEWVTSNFHIYRYFENEAFRFVSCGHERIGSKMLVENIRYKTKLRELNESFKINNNVAADLSRLFVILNPGHRKLFEFRNHTKADEGFI